MQACKSILRRAGFKKLEGPSTRLVWTCTRPETRAAPAGHAARPDGGWSHDIRSCRQPGRPGTGDPGEIHALRRVWIDNGADVPEAAVWHGKRRTNEPFSAPDAVAEEIPGTWLWGGTLWSYFAHFIVESSGRLWALDHLSKRRPTAFSISPAATARDMELSHFQEAFFAALGIDLPVRMVADSARVERLIVPGQGFGLGEISAGTPAFRDFMHARFGHDVHPRAARSSTSRAVALGPNRGKLLGEERIEQELAPQGYEIFHPQRHDMPTQLARYKAARKVVASEGSALHVFAFVGRADQSRRADPAPPVAGDGAYHPATSKSFTGATRPC